MANVIIQDERRQADIEYVAKKYGIDTNNPAMREAAEVTAVRSREEGIANSLLCPIHG